MDSSKYYFFSLFFLTIEIHTDNKMKWNVTNSDNSNDDYDNGDNNQNNNDGNHNN